MNRAMAGAAVAFIALAACVAFLLPDRGGPPEAALSQVALVATAPDGTNLWAVRTRDGTVYFTADSAGQPRQRALPMPPMQ